LNSESKSLPADEIEELNRPRKQMKKKMALESVVIKVQNSIKQLSTKVTQPVTYKVTTKRSVLKAGADNWLD
jgi:hypothetical protein